MFFEGYVYVQRISMRDKPEREKERGEGEREKIWNEWSTRLDFSFIWPTLWVMIWPVLLDFWNAFGPRKRMHGGMSRIIHEGKFRISRDAHLVCHGYFVCDVLVMSLAIVDILPYRQRSSTLLESTPNNLEIIHMLHNLLHLFEQITRLRSNIFYGPNQPRWLFVLIRFFMTLILVVRTISKVTFWGTGIPVQ